MNEELRLVVTGLLLVPLIATDGAKVVLFDAVCLDLFHFIIVSKGQSIINSRRVTEMATDLQSRDTLGDSGPKLMRCLAYSLVISIQAG